MVNKNSSGCAIW